MSGDTGSSKPISGGCGGGTTNNPVKDEAVDASPFQEGEQVLAFHGPCLYDAKVSLYIVLLYRESQLSIKSVLFRYEWYTVFTGELEQKCGVILWGKWNEMNLELLVLYLIRYFVGFIMDGVWVEQTVSAPASALYILITRVCFLGVRGKKRKHEIIEKEVCVPLEKLVNIQIPSTLKKQLVDDHECIISWARVKKDGMIVETVVEIVNGLRCYFDKALPAMLLYKHERLQYEEVIADNVSPSGVYGAEHLLRLFDKNALNLCDDQGFKGNNKTHPRPVLFLEGNRSKKLILLSEMSWFERALIELYKSQAEVGTGADLRFLQSNQSAFFQSIYQTTTSSEGFDSAVKREDN
ncbi:UNVERIFIED_CONTAM: protein MRG1 [Sesamum calycinum]|uniref:Protein MRG1 n=1 Tax=Sesamum calycinum TaxID=2727403 RepID=A0AAW2QMY4_9LAMI